MWAERARRGARRKAPRWPAGRRSESLLLHCTRRRGGACPQSCTRRAVSARRLRPARPRFGGDRSPPKGPRAPVGQVSLPSAGQTQNAGTACGSRRPRRFPAPKKGARAQARRRAYAAMVGCSAAGSEAPTATCTTSAKQCTVPRTMPRTMQSTMQRTARSGPAVWPRGAGGMGARGGGGGGGSGEARWLPRPHLVPLLALGRVACATL